MIRKDRWTSSLMLCTIAWSMGGLWLLGGAKLFRADGQYPSLEDLDHIGSFLSGFLTPAAVAWAARSLFLQREQMLQAIQTMKEDRDGQYQQRLEETDPILQLVAGMTTISIGHRVEVAFRVINHGTTARRIHYAYQFRRRDNGGIDVSGDMLVAHGVSERGGAFDIVVPFNPHAPPNPAELDGLFVIYAERLDGRVSEFVFRSEAGLPFELAAHRMAVTGLRLTSPAMP